MNNYEKCAIDLHTTLPQINHAPHFGKAEFKKNSLQNLSCHGTGSLKAESSNCMCQGWSPIIISTPLPPENCSFFKAVRGLHIALKHEEGKLTRRFFPMRGATPLSTTPCHRSRTAASIKTGTPIWDS